MKQSLQNDKKKKKRAQKIFKILNIRPLKNIFLLCNIYALTLFSSITWLCSSWVSLSTDALNVPIKTAPLNFAHGFAVCSFRW